jgi:hypothetical protein
VAEESPSTTVVPSFHRNHRTEVGIEKLAVLGLAMMYSQSQAQWKGARVIASPHRWSKFRKQLDYVEHGMVCFFPHGMPLIVGLAKEILGSGGTYGVWVIVGSVTLFALAVLALAS